MGPKQWGACCPTAFPGGRQRVEWPPGEGRRAEPGSTSPAGPGRHLAKGGRSPAGPGQSLGAPPLRHTATRALQQVLSYLAKGAAEKHARVSKHRPLRHTHPRPRAPPSRYCMAGLPSQGSRADCQQG